MYTSINVATRIKNIAKNKNISIKDILLNCGLSKNTLSSMLSGGSMPKSENLAKIADQLDCSVDYLLGRTDNPEINRKQEKIREFPNSNVNVYNAAKSGKEYNPGPTTFDDEVALAEEIENKSE